MFLQYAKTPRGFVSLLQVLVGVICQLVIQLDYAGETFSLVFFMLFNPLEIIVYIFLFATTMITLFGIVMELKGTSLVDTFGKTKTLLFHGLCFLLLIISAVVQTYNVSHTYTSRIAYYPRFIIGAIALYALSISHIFLAVLVMIWS
ncbi:hypothetical protein L596_014395 [Steinernema carpocapsae]|uniref:MARVEL domain-containing protein n=1 Tax=Steinernema carpocapsae TaxID=34508 RepID=A0A4U5NBV9_STECR|nr:hypothetical protein L596_014395 [Steinernema carpocapsae]